jgi:UDP-N-acetylglucosamine 2-epimerase (non-hydrolysing)
MKKKAILVVGIRPNYMKAWPLYVELQNTKDFSPVLVHTGQHYDHKMSKKIFDDLSLPDPDYFLNARSGTHAEQTAKIMVKFEKVLNTGKPDIVIVFGDGNTTLATALTANKMHYSVAHVEAGLRSFDEEMPEEINRKLTDQMSDLLFTPSLDGNENLINEGINKNKIHFVGNIMIDSLKANISKVKNDENKINNKYDFLRKEYCLITLHRPRNVDPVEQLSKIVHKINIISKNINVVIPLHPRTKNNLENNKIKLSKRIIELPPVGYIDFLAMQKNAKLVITDSGGIQEETTYLGITCLTLRPNTERPITITQGTNKLTTIERLLDDVATMLGAKKKKRKIPQYWDGKTSVRITKVLQKYYA